MTFILDPSSWLNSLLFGAGGVSIAPNLSIVFQTLFFVASFLVLKRVMFPPVLRVILEREKKIEQAHKELLRQDEEGQQMEQEYSDKIREARLQAQEIHNEARKEASAKEHSILAEAQEQSAQLQSKNSTELGEQRQAVVAKLDQDSEAMAQDIASKLLGRSISS